MQIQTRSCFIVRFILPSHSLCLSPLLTLSLFSSPFLSAVLSLPSVCFLILSFSFYMGTRLEVVRRISSVILLWSIISIHFHMSHFPYVIILVWQCWFVAQMWKILLASLQQMGTSYSTTLGATVLCSMGIFNNLSDLCSNPWLPPIM